MDHPPPSSSDARAAAEAQLSDAISAFELAAQAARSGGRECSLIKVEHEHDEHETEPKTMEELLPAVLAAYSKLEFISYAFPETADNYVDVARMKAALLRGKILYAITIADSSQEAYYNTHAVRSVMGSLKAADIKAELQHFSKLVRGHVVIDGKAVVETIETIKGILECLHADEVAENPANNRASTMSANQASYQQQSENEYDLIDLDDVYPRSEPRRISSTIERQLDAGLSPPVSTWADICAPVATERIIKIGQIIQPLHNLALRYGAVKPGDRIDIQLSMLLSFASRLCQFNPSTARAFPSSSN